MPTIKLCGNRYSGRAYKVRLFLKLTDTPHCYEAVDILQPRSERPAISREIADWPEVEAWLTRLSELEHWQHPDEMMRT